MSITVANYSVSGIFSIYPNIYEKIPPISIGIRSIKPFCLFQYPRKKSAYLDIMGSELTDDTLF